MSELIGEGLPGALWDVFHNVNIADEEVSLVLFVV